MNDVAVIHQAEPDPAGDRRGDAAVRELKFGARDGTLIALDHAGEISYRGLLIVEVLARDDLLVVQDLVARKQRPGVLERRFIFGERALSLDKLDLERAGIDLSQQVAGFYDLALGKTYLF